MKIKVYSQRDKCAVHELQAHVFTQHERMKRALVRLFSFIALAVISILIPVLHFILVPLFGLLAPFIAVKTYQEEVIIDECTLTCPECQKPAAFSKNSGQWPLHNSCSHCRNRIYFEAVI